MKRHEHRLAGFALPTLLLITTILMLVASAVGTLGTASIKVSMQDRDSEQASFAAEAGLVAAAEEVTRTNTLGQPFRAELPNGSSYVVEFFKNDTANPMEVVRGITIPPGTAFLHSTGESVRGRTKNSGLLLKVGNGLFRVGALGTEFDLSGSTFDSFSSEVGAYPGSKIQDAMLAASNGTEGNIFDVAGTNVEGGLFVGPGADANIHMTIDAGSNVDRQGSLNEPLEVDDISPPDIPNADLEDEGEDDDRTFSIQQPNFTVAETENGMTLDLNVPSGFHMTISPSGDVTLNNHGGAETATGNIFDDAYGVINQPPDLDDPALLGFPGDGGFVFRSRDGIRTIVLTATGELSIVEDSQFYEATIPWMAGTPPSVTNPESLVEGEYESITIDQGTTALVSDTTIVTENLNVESGGQLELPADADTVHIYVTESLTLDGQGAIINSTRKAPRLNIYYLGTDPVVLSGGSQAYFTLFAPDADLRLQGAPDAPTEFFGALVGQKITVTDANFHFDQATLGIGQGITGSNFRVLARPRY